MSTPTRPKGVLINVMGREFRVAAPDGEEKQLTASVDFLNRKMREIKDTGKVVGNERIAIMAALNITHEFLCAKDGKLPASSAFDESAVKRRIESFESIIEKALSDQDKLF
jgi:cell division protein ZapA